MLYCIAATEEPRLYEDCITIGLLCPYPYGFMDLGRESLHSFTHLLARRFCCGLWIIPTISRYTGNPTLWNGPYYIGIRTISNAITRSHLARSYSKIGQKHLLNYSKFPLSNHSFENQTLSGIGPAFLKQLCSWAPVYPHNVFSFG